MKRLLGGLMAVGMLVVRVGEVKAQYTFTTIDPPGSTYTLDNKTAELADGDQTRSPGSLFQHRG